MPEKIHFQSGGPMHAFQGRTVLLDRDKTLNADPGYLSDPGLVELLPGVVIGLQKLQSAGFQFIVLTNQSGVGRGLITPEQLYAVNLRILELLQRDHIRIERIYYCPHLDEDACSCRKPAPGLVDAALLDFQLDPGRTWVMGDRFRDLACAAHRKIPGILIGDEEGKPEDWGSKAPENLIHQAPDLSSAADLILKSGLR
ncbi:MAG TPA: HAD family hydrolase [Leptospiraceae bacterium]|nr:HAD family hydrolase [Spirochaetaceae bacterium]HBS06984.1 HAD family hydrolase [Leptospiraceae bacterium]|tara:strand:- start:5969 stop:6565 length:597 start_codon:yes stop_codon:yes gene_type:complete